MSTKTSLRTTVADAFRRRFGRAPEVVVRAPGRVNLLGAHVDYSEGWVTPAAIDRAVWLAAAPGDPSRLTLLALDLGEEVTLELRDLAPVQGEARFFDYPTGVAWALAEAGQPPPGLVAVYASDVPIGAGVSSSAAVEVAFLLAFQALGGFELSGLEGARLCRDAETRYLGLGSGLMDPYASLHGRRDHLVFLDCREETHELVGLPPGTRAVVAHSGVTRRLVDSGFNDRRAECAAAVEVLRRFLPEVRTLRDVSRDDWERCSHHLDPVLRRRSLHAVEECRRVQDGVEALRRGDLDAFHRLVRRSHLSSRDLYEVSLPELDVLAAAAWGVEGCYGARLAGGGFGGAVNALASPEAADAVATAMREGFCHAFDREPEVFVCGIGDGAGVVG